MILFITFFCSLIVDQNDMKRSNTSVLFEKLAGEIVFSHLLTSLDQDFIMPSEKHQTRKFYLNQNENNVVFDITKQLLLIDNHPHRNFDQLEADLFFQFTFEENLSLNIPPFLPKSNNTDRITGPSNAERNNIVK